MPGQIRYILNAIFGKSPPHPMVRPKNPEPLLDEYDLIKAHVEALRPELMIKFPSPTAPMFEVGRFLDQHFPIRGSWGAREIKGSYLVLQIAYPIIPQEPEPEKPCPCPCPDEQPKEATHG